jgi:hypothetical protein
VLPGARLELLHCSTTFELADAVFVSYQGTTSSWRPGLAFPNRIVISTRGVAGERRDLRFHAGSRTAPKQRV